MPQSPPMPFCLTTHSSHAHNSKAQAGLLAVHPGHAEDKAQQRVSWSDIIHGAFAQ